MTFEQLKEQMKKFNETYYNRFGIKDNQLFIKGYSHPVPFAEADYFKALQLVTDYGMFKPDALCRGKELYYKGLKWSELTREQQDSVVDYSFSQCEHGFGIEMLSESEYPAAFESNRMLYYYK